MIEDTKKEYDLFSSEHYQIIDDQKLTINTLLSNKNSNNIQHYYTTIAIITYQIKILDHLCQIHDKYTILFKKRNSLLLEKIRKELNSIFHYASLSFGISITSEFSKNSKKLDPLTELTPKRLLIIFSQLEKYSQKIKLYYDGNSKYSTIIVEIYEKLCGFSLHSINFKKYFIEVLDLRNPDYITIKKLLDFVSELLDYSATLCINTFHSHNSKNMILLAVHILEVLEVYLRLFNKNDKIPEITRKKQSWERMLNQ